MPHTLTGSGYTKSKSKPAQQLYVKLLEKDLKEAAKASGAVTQPSPSQKTLNMIPAKQGSNRVIKGKK